MAVPHYFKLADLDGEPEDIPSFCLATVDWSEPAEWDDDGHAPVGAAENKDALYVILRDHANQARRELIAYVGMTTNLPARFNTHRRADDIRKKRGVTKLSIGTVSYTGRHSRWAANNPGKALNQLEHVLIWALWPTLVNDRKMYSIPLLTGKNIGDAKPWILRSEGHRFHGRMPREIVYPWMAIKLGHDMSLNKRK